MRGYSFKIVKGKYPIVENVFVFISNSIDLDQNTRISLLIAPNMAGKSTFSRQNAL